MTLTVNLDDLRSWLAAEVAAPGADAAVLAGHFAIFSAGAAAVDLLDDDQAAPAGTRAMTDFARLTWQVACDVATSQPGRDLQFVPLVDDIQFIRPVAGERRAQETLADALAAEYLTRTPRLPNYHARELARRGIPSDRIAGNSDGQWLFSERQLRVAAVRRIRLRHAEVGGSRTGITATENGGTMTVTLPDRGDYCLVQSGHTGCAGGFVELLVRLHERGVRRLVALVPERCLAQVVLGTTVARHLFSLPEFTVVTAGIPERGTTGKAIIDGP